MFRGGWLIGGGNDRIEKERKNDNEYLLLNGSQAQEGGHDGQFWGEEVILHCCNRCKKYKSSVSGKDRIPRFQLEKQKHRLLLM